MDESAILIKALALDSTLDRHDFLSRMCQSDTSRDHVENLLERVELLDAMLEKHAGFPNSQAPQFPFLVESTYEESLGRIEHYEILRFLGEDDHVAGFIALDTTLDRVVILKTVSGRAMRRPELVQEFRAVRSAMAILSSAHVAQVVGGGESQGYPYVVLETVRGRPLNQALDSTTSLTDEDAFQIAHQATLALHALHTQELLLSPFQLCNFFFDSVTKTTKLSGLSCPGAAGSNSFSKMLLRSVSPNSDPPELASHQIPDVRSDLFCLGQLFNALLQKLQRPSAAQRTRSTDGIEFIDQTHVFSNWFRDVTEVLLSEDPEERFQSTADLLDVFAAHEPKQVIETASLKSLMRPKRKGFLGHPLVILGMLSSFAAITVCVLTLLGSPRRSFLGPWMPYLTHTGILIVEASDPTMVFTVNGLRRPETFQGSFHLGLPPRRYQITGYRDKRPVYFSIVDIKWKERTFLYVGEIERLTPWSSHTEFDASQQPDIKAALWILEHGGSIEITNDASNQKLKIFEKHELPLKNCYLASAQIDKFPAEDLPDLLNVLAACSRFRKMTLSGPRITGDHLARVGQIKTLRTLEMKNVVDATLEQFQQLKEIRLLETICFDYSPHVSEFLTVAKELPNLKSISVTNCPVHDQHLKAVADMRGLKSVKLSSRFLTAEALKYLSKLSQLTKLEVESPQMTDACWNFIAELKNLEQMMICGVEREPQDVQRADGIRSLSSLAKLRFVVLTGIDFDRESFAQLSKLDQIHSLNLQDCDLTSVEFDDVAGMSALCELIVNDCVLSDLDMAKIRLTMPKCVIALTNISPPNL